MLHKKITMLGAYGVGKTSLVKRFVESLFDEKYHATIGVKVDKKSVNVDGTEMQLMLWDVAGSEEMYSVPPSYLKGAAGYLIVVDQTRPESVDAALGLRALVASVAGDKVPGIVLVINKSDLDSQLDEQHEAALKELGCPILRSSAKTGEGVEEAFEALARQLV